MLKPNLFILLSGMIAASAVYGWMDVEDPQSVRKDALGENRPIYPDAPDKAVSAGVEALNRSSSQALKALADAAVQTNLAEILTAQTPSPTTPSEHADVVHPKDAASASKMKDKQADEPPVQNPSSQYQTALEAIQNTDILQDAQTLAIINLADGRLLAATNDKKATEFLARPRRRLPLSGTDYSITDDTLESWSWYCLGKSGKICVAANFKTTPRMTTEDGCISASRATGILCGETILAGARIFNGENCHISQYPDTSSHLAALQGIQTQSGVADKLIFSKQAISANCTLISAIPETAVNILSDEAILAREKDFKFLRLIIAFAAAIAVIILGLICIRRKDDEKHQAELQRWEMRESALHSKLSQLTQKLKTLEVECERLKDKAYDLQKDKDDSEQACSRLLCENAQIREKLDLANKTNRQSSLTIQSLEVETASLRDQLANHDDAAVGEKTLVTTCPQNLSTTSRTEIRHVMHAIPEDDDMDGKTDPPYKMMMPSSPTRPVSEANLPTYASTSSKTEHNLPSLLSFDDDASDDATSLSHKTPFWDNTWDDLTDSLDAFLGIPNTAQKEAEPSAAPQSPTPTPSPEPSQSSTPNPDNTAHTSTTTATHRLGTLRKQATELSSATDRGPMVTPPASEPAFSSLQSQTTRASVHDSMPFGVPSMPKADAVTSKSTEGVAESFKPSPSWSGRKLSDQAPEMGSVSQELVNALQRRARDVSQINTAVSKKDADPQAGALNFNRTMSKSGMFSLTGSRSKISLKNDADKTYFNDLYDKYVESMCRNGEDPTKYTREQFISRMAREKETLMSKFQCSDVSFTIYTKEGKTSLKAIPKK